MWHFLYQQYCISRSRYFIIISIFMYKEQTWRKGTGQCRQAIIRSKAQPEEKIDETQTLRKKKHPSTCDNCTKALTTHAPSAGALATPTSSLSGTSRNQKAMQADRWTFGAFYQGCAGRPFIPRGGAKVKIHGAGRRLKSTGQGEGENPRGGAKKRANQQFKNFTKRVGSKFCQCHCIFYFSRTLVSHFPARYCEV